MFSLKTELLLDRMVATAETVKELTFLKIYSAMFYFETAIYSGKITTFLLFMFAQNIIRHFFRVSLCACFVFSLLEFSFVVLDFCHVKFGTGTSKEEKSIFYTKYIFKEKGSNQAITKC